MQQSIAAILSVTEIFDNLNNTQLELVASVCELVAYNQGEVLLKENESTTEL